MHMEYREFFSKKDAEKWGIENYKEVSGANADTSAEFKLLYEYAGNMYTPFNRILRYSLKDNDYMCDIEKLIQILTRYQLKEDIVTYRYTSKSDIRSLLSKKFIKKGLYFSDRAFFSTSLVLDCIKEFAKKNKYNCLLKLYLLQGTHGAYIDLSETDSLLNEQEFLLPPNTKFQIIKVHYFSFPMLIECKVILD